MQLRCSARMLHATSAQFCYGEVLTRDLDLYAVPHPSLTFFESTREIFGLWKTKWRHMYHIRLHPPPTYPNLRARLISKATHHFYHTHASTNQLTATPFPRPRSHALVSLTALSQIPSPWRASSTHPSSTRSKSASAKYTRRSFARTTQPSSARSSLSVLRSHLVAFCAAISLAFCTAISLR